MKRKRYTEEKTISILKQHDASASLPDSLRCYGIAENTIYRWRSKFGGMEVSETKKLRELEDENSRLKQIPGLVRRGGIRHIDKRVRCSALESDLKGRLKLSGLFAAANRVCEQESKKPERVILRRLK